MYTCMYVCMYVCPYVRYCEIPSLPGFLSVYLNFNTVTANCCFIDISKISTTDVGYFKCRFRFSHFESNMMNFYKLLTYVIYIHFSHL